MCYTYTLKNIYFSYKKIMRKKKRNIYGEKERIQKFVFIYRNNNYLSIKFYFYIEHILLVFEIPQFALIVKKTHTNSFF